MTYRPPEITVDRLLASSFEDGECLIWKGAMANGTCPVCRVDGKVHVVRRLVWRALGHHLVAKVAIVTSCDNERCVHPDHLVKGKTGPKLGSRKTLLMRSRLAASLRAVSRLTAEDVAEVRVSDESCEAAGRRLNMSASTIGLIRKGETWRDFSSPYIVLESL